MSIKTKAVLIAAIVLGTAVAASAATKNDKLATHQRGAYGQATVSGVPAVADPENNPATTGGGSLGYNENMRKDDW
jgi:ABC-type transport system substrate-binding protein